MFNFALDREWIEANPASRIPEPGEEKSRDRVLSDEELRELWLALECLAAEVEDKTDEAAQTLRRAKARVTPATAQAFQVQLLTAQRPGETQKMRWADVDLESGWCPPPSALTMASRSRHPRHSTDSASSRCGGCASAFALSASSPAIRSRMAGTNGCTAR
jgi:integrase